MRDYPRDIRDALESEDILAKVNAYLDELRLSTSGPKLGAWLDLLPMHSVSDVHSSLLAVERVLHGAKHRIAGHQDTICELRLVLGTASKRANRLREIAAE